jgi:hypothetical protein
MHFSFPSIHFACWALFRSADDDRHPLDASQLDFFLYFLITSILNHAKMIHQNCTAPNLPLNTNHICTVCNRPVHGICVGKHVEDQPLGRDIICLDCAKATSEAGPKDEDEGAMTTATVQDASYMLTNIGIHQPGEHCSYKKGGISVFITD